MLAFTCLLFAVAGSILSEVIALPIHAIAGSNAPGWLIDANGGPSLSRVPESMIWLLLTVLLVQRITATTLRERLSSGPRGARWTSIAIFGTAIIVSIVTAGPAMGLLALVPYAAPQALAEEVGFRWGILRLLNVNDRPLRAIFVSSICFTFAHVTQGLTPVHIASYLAGGLTLAIIYYTLDSLVIVWALHVFVNVGEGWGSWAAMACTVTIAAACLPTFARRRRTTQEALIEAPQVDPAVTELA